VKFVCVVASSENRKIVRMTTTTLRRPSVARVEELGERQDENETPISRVRVHPRFLVERKLHGIEGHGTELMELDGTVMSLCDIQYNYGEL